MLSKELKRFLKGNWELDHEGDDYLFDKMLLEFPIFALNEDYMKAIANIVGMKIDQARNQINQKQTEVQKILNAQENTIKQQRES